MGVEEGLFDRGKAARDDVDEILKEKLVTGDEMAKGDPVSISPRDLLTPSGDGEQGGEPVCLTSPSELERLPLALELAVGFM